MNRIVILAAGRGTRMNSDLPKVLVPLNGRIMIKYLLDSVFEAGLDAKPLIVVSPENIDLIKKELTEYNLEYVVQDQQLGTGHAVACVQKYLDKATDKVLVLYGDHPFLQSNSMKKFLEADNESLIIMPTKLSNYDGWQQNFYHWGRIIRGVNNKVERIVEFKDATDEEKLITEVNPGFMCFNYKWLFANIENLKNNNKSAEYYLTDMVSLAFAAGHEVKTINIEAKEAMGINSLEELEIAVALLS